MSEEMIERHQGDEMIRLTLMDGQVRVMMCETTQMAQRAADIHGATPVCTAAMGRLMTATSMLGVMMKGDNESVTVNIHGDGPMGTIVAVANHGDVKVCADDARVELPLRADGKLDVGGAIGHTGRMTVIKDLGLKEPYVGTIELVSGELGIDFAQYFTVSEQQPSLVSLGVLVGDKVEAAGGLIIQMLPGASEAAIQSIETSAGMFMDISGTMREYHLNGAVNQLLLHLEPEILSRSVPAYRCDCSRERVERALISLGREELEDMICEQHGAQVDCHFCNKRYELSEEQLRDLLKRATDRRSE